MSKILALVFAGTVFALGSFGCGSSDDSGGGSSGLDKTKKLSALTDTEKQQLCDWQAQHYGGYGKSLDCGSVGSIPADESQAGCVSRLPEGSCAATVGDAETCTNGTSCKSAPPKQCADILDCLYPSNQ